MTNLLMSSVTPVRVWLTAPLGQSGPGKISRQPPTEPNLLDFGRCRKTVVKLCTKIIVVNRCTVSFSEMLACRLNVQMHSNLLVVRNLEYLYHQVTLTLSHQIRDHACLGFVAFLATTHWKFSLACSETSSKCQPICRKETAIHLNVQKTGRFENIRQNDDNHSKFTHVCFKMKIDIS